MKDFLSHVERPYLAFSGGKDSEACLILLKMINRTDIPVFTQCDDLDFPQKKKKCQQILQYLGFKNYSFEYSEMSALNQLKTSDVISGTFSHVVKRYIEQNQNDGYIMGIRVEESKKRKFNIGKLGNLTQLTNGMWRCLPVAFWSGIDVFALILSLNCPYMDVYDCDEWKAPHEIRFSWMYNPDFAGDGSALFLKRYYSEQYEKLRRINPTISTFT